MIAGFWSAVEISCLRVQKLRNVVKNTGRYYANGDRCLETRTVCGSSRVIVTSGLKPINGTRWCHKQRIYIFNIFLLNVCMLRGWMTDIARKCVIISLPVVQFTYAGKLNCQKLNNVHAELVKSGHPLGCQSYCNSPMPYLKNPAPWFSGLTSLKLLYCQ